MSILRSLAATDLEFVATNHVSAQTLFYRAKRLALALDRLTIISTPRASPTHLRAFGSKL